MTDNNSMDSQSTPYTQASSHTTAANGNQNKGCSLVRACMQEHVLLPAAHSSRQHQPPCPCWLHVGLRTWRPGRWSARVRHNALAHTLLLSRLHRAGFAGACPPLVAQRGISHSISTAVQCAACGCPGRKHSPKGWWCHCSSTRGK